MLNAEVVSSVLPHMHNQMLQCSGIQLPLQVADLFVMRIAAQQALAQQHRGKLITKSLHAELVYNMSGSRHVSLLTSWHHHSFAEVMLLVGIHSRVIISCSPADI